MSKKQHVAYRVDSFVDYEGNVRKFVICAISDVIAPTKYYGVNPDCECVSLENVLLTSVIETTIDGNGDAIIDERVVGDVAKRLSLGISIQNKNDKFDEEIGKRVAYGRAQKKPYSKIYTTTEGVINTPMVEAVLKQECAYFKQVPYLETWGIKGYSEAAKKYFKTHKNTEAFNQTTQSCDTNETERCKS